MPISAALLALALQGPVEVPFRIGDNAIIVDAVVNGKKLSCMFDTGFSGCVVCDDTINMGPASGTMTLRDFVGEFQAKTVAVKSLKLGAMNIDPTDMEIVQQPSAHLSASYNTHTDGIMGFEVIRHNITEINFQNNKFVFHPRSMDITKRVPDNKKTFLVKMLPMGNNSIECEVLTKDGKRLILALDTGNAFYATTHKDVLERVGMWKSGQEPKFMKSSFVASGEVGSFYKTMPNMTIFGVPVENSVWSIIDLPSSSAEGDGTVGFGFLRNFNVVIDYDRRRVWLENWTGKTGSDQAAEIGVTALYDERSRKVRVYRVAPESPAAKAGIKVGDAILAVNDEDLGHPGYRQMTQMLEGPTGSKVKLVISRGGNLIRLEVERALLVND